MNVETLEGFFGVGIGTLASKGDGGLDILLPVLLDLRRLSFAEDTVLEQTGAQDFEGIASFPLHEFLLGAVIEHVKKWPFGVMAEAIGLGFYQRRSLPSPCALDGLADHFVDCNGILSIDRDARDIVGLGTLRDIVHRDGFFYRDGDSVAVVFAQV